MSVGYPNSLPLGYIPDRYFVRPVVYLSTDISNYIYNYLQNYLQALLAGKGRGEDRVPTQERGSVINYCSRQLVINDQVVVNFDPKPSTVQLR